jgi:MFS family permease
VRAGAVLGAWMRRAPSGLVGTLVAVRLVDESSQFILPGTAAAVLADLGLSYTELSSALVLVAVGAVAGAPLTVAADRCGRRVVCVCGAALCAISLAMAGVATSFAGLAVSCFLGGVASTAMVDVAELALADVAGDDLERHLTTQNVLASIGDVVGPAIVIGTITLGGSWRACFLGAAALAGLYAAWLARLPFPAAASDGEGKEEGVGAVLRAVMRDPAVWLVGAVAALLNPLDEPLLAFFVPHLEQARGVGRAAAVVIASMSVVGAFVGYASLRARPAHLAVDAPALAAATVACLVAPDAATATIASGAVGVFLARVWVDVQRRSLVVRPGQAGTVRAVMTVVESGALALPLVAGAAADAAGPSGGLAAFAVMACGLAVAGVALHHSDPRRGRRAAPPANPD